ncbi:hypothetical protein JCM3770_003924 [Rhodotorula araucariae]
MGAFYDEIPDSVVDWIREQRMFWVATAPLAGSGTVNVSPKGYDCFTVVSPTAVWYLDCSGSGNETISHLREPGNGRLTIMFSAFQGPPRILRLFGRGRVFERDTLEFDKLLPPGDARRLPGARAIIWLDVDRVGTSCGFSVPFFHYDGERTRLMEFFEAKEAADRAYLYAHIAQTPSSAGSTSPVCPTLAPASVRNGMRAYWKLKNAESVDGLPGLEAAGFPPEEGAIRKSRPAMQKAYSHNAGGAVHGVWARGAQRAADWTAEVALLAGLLVGMWVGKEYL